ncbi:MAG: O-antigen ligase family protein [Chthoniobacterales bacterium]
MSGQSYSSLRLSQSALRSASAWMLCGALVYAPWNYGSVSEPGVVALNALLGAVLILWSVAAGLRLAQRGRNHAEIRNSHSAICIFPLALLVPTGLLLLLGWGMVLNAKAIYDSDFYLFVPLTRGFPRLVGSIDQAVSAAMMVRVTLLLGMLWMVADLVRDPRWLLRLWWTMGLTGASIALLGLIQKASGAPMIFWQATQQPVTTFFSTFYYHGNAGAFLNLTLPVTIGLAWRSFTRRENPVVRAVAATGAVISVVAVFSNTSRMAQGLAAGMLLVVGVALLPRAFGLIRARLEWPTFLVGAIALALALAAVVQTSHLDRGWKRWEKTGETVSNDARWNAARAAWAALPEAGWHGFGAGTFAIVFPYFTGGFGTNLEGRWIFLHEDYLQTALEWGWLGAGLFGVIFFGGMGVGALGAGLSVRRERLLREKKRGTRKADCGMAEVGTSGAARAGLSEKGERLLDKTGGTSGASDNHEAITTNWRAAWTPRQRLLVPLVLLALGSVALHALVDFPLQIASIQLYAATYLGICWGSVGFGESRK